MNKTIKLFIEISIDFIKNNYKGIITFLTPYLFFLYQGFTKNITFSISLIIISILATTIIKLYNSNKKLQETIDSYDEYDENFEVMLNDGTVVKPGTEIQLKTEINRILIPISYCKTKNTIKYSFGKNQIDESHLTSLKKYKYVSTLNSF